jgi:2-polyprenyl-6-hydroxyphenyl methylase/3-demethylubiquinone-9 3-methyltransferase
MLRRFFEVNRRMSRWLERRLPHAREDLFAVYETTVARHMNARSGQLVVDVGGGKGCPFSRFRRPELGTRIVAVDVEPDELRDNRDVDEARIADIMTGLPFAAREVDMIVSRSVLEHLTNVEAFIASSSAALSDGGYFIHLVPARNAPFAVLNRALPAWLSRRIMHFFHPHTVGICGFPAFYDRCDAGSLTRLLDGHGFDVEECCVSYYQSRYFDFFFPLYIASVLYELAARATGRPALGAYLLIVARRRAAAGNVAVQAASLSPVRTGTTVPAT